MAGTIKKLYFADGADVTEPTDISLTVGTVDLTTDVTGTLPVANGGTGVTTSTGTGATVRATSPTLVTPLLGTPTSGLLTNATGLPLTSGVTGTLPVANGGTGVTTSTGSGDNVLSTSPTLVTPILGTPTSGTLTNATGLPLTSGVTGTLPIANGGTGQTSAANAINALVPTQSGNTGKFLKTDGSVVSWDTATGSSGETGPLTLSNYSIVASVGSSILTLALKSAAGSDATVGDPVTVAIRDEIDAAGNYNVRTVTGALSIDVSSGATLGHISAVFSYVYIYLIDNAGTLELAVSTKKFDEITVVNTTTMSSSSDSATVMYSTTGRSNVPFRLIGRLASTQTTAGTWATGPSQIALGDKFLESASTAIVKSELTAGSNISIDAGTATSFGRWKMVGNLVFISVRWNTINISGSVASFSFTLPATLPDPISTVATTCLVYDNSGSVSTVSSMDINTSKLMTITKPSGTFTGGVNTSYLFGQIVYLAD